MRALPRPLLRAGLVLGFGLGGFADGILLHQVLRWHHLVSARTDDAALNALADGLFHAAMWVATAVGLALLWRARGMGGTGRALAGAILLGVAAFHAFDSLVFHALLGAHHIRPHGPGGYLVWDLGYLALGVVLGLAGLALMGVRDARARP